MILWLTYTISLGQNLHIKVKEICLGNIQFYPCCSHMYDYLVIYLGSEGVNIRLLASVWLASVSSQAPRFCISLLIKHLSIEVDDKH